MISVHSYLIRGLTVLSAGFEELGKTIDRSLTIISYILVREREVK